MHKITNIGDNLIKQRQHSASMILTFDGTENKMVNIFMTFIVIYL